MNADDPLTEEELRTLHEEDEALRAEEDQMNDEITNPAYDFLPYNIWHEDDTFGGGFGGIGDDDF